MTPGVLTDVGALVLGLVTGALSGAFGVGGAVVSTPGVRLLGASALVAVGTTLPSILPGAVAGSLRYLREGLIDRSVVAAAAPPGVVMAVVGSFASHRVPGDGHWLMVMTALLVGLTAVRLARGALVPARAAAGAPPAPPPRWAAATLGGLAGTLSGLLGVGGGTILVPGFAALLRLPLKVTIATSLACVGILAVPATVAHAVLGDIDWRLAVLLALTVVPGARLGAAATIRARERTLRLAVAAALGVLAVVYLVAEIRFLLT